MLCLHKAIIEKLGLRFARSAGVRTVIPNPDSGGKYTLDLLLLPTAARAPAP